MKSNLSSAIKTYFLGGGGARVALALSWAQHLQQNGYRRFALLVFRWLERAHGVYIAPNAVIGAGVRFPHPTAIVIGDGVRIGEGCTIYQGVTLGGARQGDAQSRKYPSVGDRTTIFAGAVIVGAVEIGADCLVGANAVVTCDVPAKHVAVGVPARSFPQRGI